MLPQKPSTSNYDFKSLGLIPPTILDKTFSESVLLVQYNKKDKLSRLLLEVTQ